MSETWSASYRRRPCDLWPSWLVRRLYTLGLSSGSMHTWTPDGRTIRRAFFRGRRPYVLFISRDQWRCLLSRHPHWPKMLNHGGDFGMCGRCYPCPDCDSETDEHPDSCLSFGVAS